MWIFRLSAVGNFVSEFRILFFFELVTPRSLLFKAYFFHQKLYLQTTILSFYALFASIIVLVPYYIILTKIASGLNFDKRQMQLTCYIDEQLQEECRLTGFQS